MTEQPSAGPDDVKRRMREALERKNSRTKAGETHQDHRSKVGPTHDQAGSKRSFRRKTG